MDAAGDCGRPAESGCPPPEAGGSQQQQQEHLREGEQQCCCACSSAHTLSKTHRCCCHRPRADAVLPTAASSGPAAASTEARGESAKGSDAREEPRQSAATTMSEWVARAASLRYCLLESAVPVKISLEGSEVATLQPPPPLLLLLLRNSYFPHIFATCYEHFQLALRPSVGECSRCPPSFTYQGRLLDWRLPVGVSFDCVAGPAPAGRRTRPAAPAAGQRRRQPAAAAAAPSACPAAALRHYAVGASGRGEIGSSSSAAAAPPCCFCSSSSRDVFITAGKSSADGDASLSCSSSSSSSSRLTRVCGSCSRSCCCSCKDSCCYITSANNRGCNSLPPDSQAATVADGDFAANKGIEQGQRGSALPPTEVNVSEISTEEEVGEEETEEEDAKEEELIVVEAAEAAGCAVALPWQLTVHFRTPASVLAAASNSRAAATAAAVPTAAGDACCCSCAALRQQQQQQQTTSTDVSAGNSTTACGAGATAATAAATARAATTPTTARVVGGVTTAALGKKRGNLKETDNNGGASKGKEEQAAAAEGEASAGGAVSVRECTPLEEEGQAPAGATCSTREDRAAPATAAAGDAATPGPPSRAASRAAVCATNGGAAAAVGSSSSSVTTTTSPSMKGSLSGGPPAAAEETLLVLPSVPPPAYEGWGYFENFFTNVIRQATFLLTGSAAAFHCLARAEEAALLRALRCLDIPAFLHAIAPLVTPLVLPPPAAVGRTARADYTRLPAANTCVQPLQRCQRAQQHSLLQQHERSASQEEHSGSSCNSSTRRVDQTEAGAGPSAGLADLCAGEAAAEVGGCGDPTAAENAAAAAGVAHPPPCDATTPSGSAGWCSAEKKSAPPAATAETAGTALRRGRVAGMTGPKAAGDAGANAADDRAAAAKGAARSEQQAQAAATAAQQGGRKGFGRTLRRLPVRVHLVSSCCSGVAHVAAARGASSDTQQHHVEVSSRRVGGHFSSVSLGGLHGGTRDYCLFMADRTDAGAADADDSWCCVSSVLLACPPFVPAAASCSGSPGGVEPNSSKTSPSSLPWRSDKSCCSSSEVGLYGVRSCGSDRAGRDEGYDKKDQPHSNGIAYTVSRGGYTAAAAPACCVDEGSNTRTGQMWYTLGDMLHDLLPQLFPVKTWKRERKRASRCCCSSFVCSDGSSFFCCHTRGCGCCSLFARSRLTDTSKHIVRTRTTGLVEQQQQHDYMPKACGCGAAGSSSSSINAAGRGGGEAACGCSMQQQDADGSGNTNYCHSCCCGAAGHASGERLTQERDGDGEGDKRWVDFLMTSQVAQGDGEEDQGELLIEEDVVEESLQERPGSKVLSVSSRFEQGSSRRSLPSCRVLVQGVEPLLDTPLYWLWLNAASFDYFLHVVVRLPPYL